MKDIAGNEVRAGAIVVVAIDEGNFAAMRWAVIDLMRATSRGTEYAAALAIRLDPNGHVIPRSTAIYDGSLAFVIDRSRVPDDVLTALDDLRPPRHHEQLNQPSDEPETIDLRIKAIEGRLSEIDGRLSAIEARFANQLAQYELRYARRRDDGSSETWSETVERASKALCDCPVEFEPEAGEWDYDGPDEER